MSSDARPSVRKQLVAAVRNFNRNWDRRILGKTSIALGSGPTRPLGRVKGRQRLSLWVDLHAAVWLFSFFSLLITFENYKFWFFFRFSGSGLTVEPPFIPNRITRGSYPLTNRISSRFEAQLVESDGPVRLWQP